MALVRRVATMGLQHSREPTSREKKLSVNLEEKKTHRNAMFALSEVKGLLVLELIVLLRIKFQGG